MIPTDSTVPRRRVLLLLAYHLTATEQGVVKYAREAGWTLDLRTLRSGVLPEPGGIDGILCLLGGWESRPELTDYVRSAGVPVVDMHADEAGNVAAGRVLVNNRMIGELAAQHFATRGFSRCLFCCRSLSDWSARERGQAFVRALEQQGIGHRIFEHVAAVSNRFPVVDMLPHLVAALEEEALPLGVFAENDDVAALVLDACEQLGIRVPEQVAVLGCGNDPLVVDFTRVPLSSIDPDIAGRAYQAAHLLGRLMDGEPVPEKPVLIEPPGIVTRQSTDILAVPDLRVAAALTLIRRDFTAATLNPNSVSVACGVPPRTLARLFKQHLKRSVADEIARLRRQRAQQLLASTALSASEIAHQVGFASLLHMRRNLQRHTKLSPRQWRQRKGARER
jgi:LacI family transcriptional regulator